MSCVYVLKLTMTRFPLLFINQILGAFLCSLLSITAMAQPVTAEPGPATVQVYFVSNEGAIRGYDPVAYFKENKAVKGNKSFSCQWSGANWYFKDQANLDVFKSFPEKYAPQFGGYCAYGVSENHKSPTDPLAFTIVNDKLYLNYNAKVKAFWVKGMDERIGKGNLLWPVLAGVN